MQLHTPLPLTIILVAVAAALVGLIIERFGLRPLQNSVRIAPLLATIGISFVLDQLVMLTFSPNPRALPSQLPDVRFQIGGGTIGPLDLLIAGVGLTSALLLFVFLRYSKLGWAVRATAQDRDAAMQMGVDVNRVNQAVFGIAAALGGVSGLLVGMYYNQIDTAMSLQATLKGVVAEVVGGAGNVPGAVIGSLLLGLVESYGVAVFGTSYRNLFAFLLLVVVLVLRPNGLFASARQAPPEPLTGTFIAPSRPVWIPRWALLIAAVVFAILPLLPVSFYVLQTLINAWLLGMLALSLTLVGRHDWSGLAGTRRAARDRRLHLRAAVAHVRCPGRPCHHRRRPDECGAGHGADLAVVPAARTLCVDRDARDRRDRLAGDPELGERHARADRHLRHPAAVAVWL
ncbi:branched-subunit amino acid ABC-type transport system permease component [Bradyrhizobium sp. GM2.4]